MSGDSNIKLSELLQLLDTLDWGISIFDKEGRFLWINRYVVRRSGRNRTEYIGKSVHDFHSEGILDVPVIEEALREKKSIRRLQRSVSAYGKTEMFLVTAKIIYDGYGKVNYCIADRIKVEDLGEKYQFAVTEMKEGEPISVVRKGENEDIVCESPAMKQILRQAEQIADIDANVLLSGESGTGKDVIAHYIYRKSTKFRKNIVEINCASMPESLLESELFGYEKGAFTGALNTGKKGLIEAADQGVLFLDEINSMPLGLQAKLLRSLESKTITKIGSVKPIRVNFRLVAATNRDLRKCVQNGTFREDLFYRINVIPINIPPLSQREEDIRPLTDFFLHKFCTMYGVVKEFAQPVYDSFLHYTWPGNVRELRNVVERIVVMSSADTVKISELPESIFAGAPAVPAQGPGQAETLREHGRQEEPLRRNAAEDLYESGKSVTETVRERRQEAEKEAIREALLKTGGHREKTAQLLGISRRALQYKLKKYGML